MKVLLVIDVQNEFSSRGRRPVPNHVEALQRIRECVAEARQARHAIAWVRHRGSDLSPGLGPRSGFGPERLFEKDVFGAFSGTGLGEWLQDIGVTEVLIVGFYTHTSVSTTAREALDRGFAVSIDPEATGACDLDDDLLGRQSADDVCLSALLHLVNMGVAMTKPAQKAYLDWLDGRRAQYAIG